MEVHGGGGSTRTELPREEEEKCIGGTATVERDGEVTTATCREAINLFAGVGKDFGVQDIRG